MISFLADHNFNAVITRGFRRRCAERAMSIDLVTAGEIGMATASDAELLAFAAADRRVILTHDVNTLIADAYARVRARLAMPGVFATRDDAPVGRVIEDLVLLLACSHEGEWEGQIIRLPFQ